MKARSGVITVIGAASALLGMIGLGAFSAGLLLGGNVELRPTQVTTGLSIAFICTLWLISGIGVLRMKPWGWWLFGVALVLAVFRHGQAVYYLIAHGPMTLVDPWLPPSKLLFFITLSSYWFSSAPRRWFDVRTRLATALSTVVGVVALVVAFFTFLPGLVVATGGWL